MTTQEKEKLNRVQTFLKNKMDLGTACQLLGYDLNEIKKLQNENIPDLPDFMKDLFKGFDEKRDH